MTKAQAVLLANLKRLAASLPHGQRPTDKHITIFLVLLRWCGPCPPTHAQIALKAHCSKRTVVNALARLRALNVLDWVPRYGVDMAGTVRRMANRYVFGGRLEGRKREFVPCSAIFALTKREKAAQLPNPLAGSWDARYEARV